MFKSDIFINVSDIASFIGQNKWNYVESFERLWKKYDPEYITCLNSLNSKVSDKNIELMLTINQERIVEENLTNGKITKRQYDKSVKEITNKKILIEKVIEDIMYKVNDISLTQTEKIQNSLGKEIIDTISSSNKDTLDKRKITNAAINKLDIKPEIKVELLKQTESLINKTHGTLKEDSAIQLFQNKFNVILNTKQDYFKTLVKETDEFCFYVGGRFDGICESEGYLVEVKNRMKGFFSDVRDYELTQIQIYLLLSIYKKAKLVEKYNKKIKVTDIELKQEYIDDVLDYLCIFIEKFLIFISDYKMKMQFIQSDETNKQKFINKLYLSEINKARQLRLDIKVVNADEDCLINDFDDY